MTHPERTFLTFFDALTVVEDLAHEFAREAGDDVALRDQHVAARKAAAAAVPRTLPPTARDMGTLSADVASTVALMVIQAALSTGLKPVELCPHVGDDPDEALLSPRPVMFCPDPLSAVCVDCSQDAVAPEPLVTRWPGQCDACGARPDDGAILGAVLQAGSTVVMFGACTGCMAWLRSLSDGEAA